MALPIFKTQQVAALDAYTISHEPIESIQLMERAATMLYLQFTQHFDVTHSVCVVAGPGNNGGDALALARLLICDGYQVQVCLVQADKHLSADCHANLVRLQQEHPHCLVAQVEQLTTATNSVIVDGLFGAGLNRPVDGAFASAIHFINEQSAIRVAIDIPSGLQGERVACTDHAIVKAHYTFTLQFPKLAFMLPENDPYVGQWHVLDIGIHPHAIQHTPSTLHYLQDADVQIKPRAKFSHKGNYGHVLMLVGSKGMAGAGVLAAKAALRTGASLVSIHGPECNRVIAQVAVPEAMYHADSSTEYISQIPNVHNYTTCLVGCGIGTQAATQHMLRDLLSNIDKPCVIDADALNIMALHKDLLDLIPNLSILTPHPREFERLFGATANSLEQLMLASQQAQQYKIIIVLKGAHTRLCTPDGHIYFNSSGNAGMATAGMGDALAGIISALLAQGYSPQQAAIMGVYMHGRAADKCLAQRSMASLMTSDVIDAL